MKISVIVPVYNSEKYLERCLDSIATQTYKDLEILLIDDGSTDNSGKICDLYSGKDSRFKAIHCQNNGVAVARNTGLDNASGEYIGFVDSDDYIEPFMYEKLVEAVKRNGADIGCCGFFRQEPDKTYPKHRPDGEEVLIEGQINIFREYLRRDYENGFGEGNWNKIIKKSLCENVRYKDYTNGEDVDFQVELFKKSEKIVCISDLLYHYMCNPESASRKEFSEKYAGILSISDEIQTYIDRNQPENSAYACAFKLTWYISVLMKIYSSDNPRKYKIYLDRIRSTVIDRYDEYVNNSYAKRLDKYLATAVKYRVVGPALMVRKLVRILRK